MLQQKGTTHGGITGERLHIFAMMTDYLRTCARAAQDSGVECRDEAYRRREATLPDASSPPLP